ncbi:MAG: hypothetical protein CL933_01975 [Deltaproteobacteria bacterium]|nr:hypothetical protein [Deltaproteobacteria bacterium]
MSLFWSIFLVTTPFLLFATSAQAQLELCFDEQVAYDPSTDRSWVTDYRSTINGGYGLEGPLDSLGGNVGVIEQASLVDVHGVTGWRIPTSQEYLDIFPHTGDCGAGSCTLTGGQGWSNPPWWNANGAHLHTAQCLDLTLAPCGHAAHLSIHGETQPGSPQGAIHSIDWYSNDSAWLVQTGNVCPAVEVPSSGLAGRSVLVAVLMGLTALWMSAPRRG